MSKSNKKKNTDQQMANVLYQRLGNTWYAFTEVAGECYMSRVDEDSTEIETAPSDTALDEFFHEAIPGTLNHNRRQGIA